MGGYPVGRSVAAIVLAFVLMGAPVSALSSANVDLEVELGDEEPMRPHPGATWGHQSQGVFVASMNESVLLFEVGFLTNLTVADYRLDWLGNTTFVVMPMGADGAVQPDFSIASGPGDACITLTSSGGYDVRPEHCKPAG